MNSFLSLIVYYFRINGWFRGVDIKEKLEWVSFKRVRQHHKALFSSLSECLNYQKRK